MNSKSAGQLACEAFWAAVRIRNGGEDAGDWPGNAWEWAGETNSRESWEAAAAAVETEQLREIRADRDQLKKRMLDLASAWKDEAADDLTRIRPAPGGSTRADVLQQCAAEICKGLDI